MSDKHIPPILHPILSHAIPNLHNLRSIRLHGHVFQDMEQQELFFNPLTTHCPLVEKLSLVDLSSDFSTPSLVKLHLKSFGTSSGSKCSGPLPILKACLILIFFHSKLIDHMIKPIVEASCQSLQEIIMPVCFKADQAHWLWSMQFPCLKSIVIPGSHRRHNLIIPPKPSIEHFFLNNVQPLDYIEFIFLPGFFLDSRNDASHCRLSYTSHPTKPEIPITIRSIHCRLEVFEHYSEQIPASFKDSLESLTLQYSYTPKHNRLLRRLWKAFNMNLYRSNHTLPRLCSFQLNTYFPQTDPESLDAWDTDRALSFLTTLSYLCGSTLTTLHGAIYPTPINDFELALKLSKFTKLKTFSIYTQSINSTDVNQVSKYASTLARFCHSLTEIIICEHMLNDCCHSISEPIWLMRFELKDGQILKFHSYR
jgi:hypothetical protein